MEVNADFGLQVIVHSEELDWRPSPMPGVERRMLDRIGDEVARATTIVRYAPGSQFSPHVHGGGEEFLVLEGVFRDEHGFYPAGTYVRNPPESEHTPGSDPGCVLFVKLHQFDLRDRTQLRCSIDDLAETTDLERPGVLVSVLHQDDRELVGIERWSGGTTFAQAYPGGAEFLVLEGGFEASGSTLARGSWLRVPPGGRLQAVAAATGTRLWVKTGHLRFAPGGIEAEGAQAE